PGGVRGLGGCVDYAGKEEIEPALPIAGLAHGLQALVVRAPVRLEVEAEVQQRLAHHLALAQKKRDQQPAEAAVAVEERVDRLELHVREARHYEHRDLGRFRVEEALEVA